MPEAPTTIIRLAPRLQVTATDKARGETQRRQTASSDHSGPTTTLSAKTVAAIGAPTINRECILVGRFYTWLDAITEQRGPPAMPQWERTKESTFRSLHRNTR